MIRIIRPDSGTLDRGSFHQLVPSKFILNLIIDLSKISFITPWGVAGLCNLLFEICSLQICKNLILPIDKNTLTYLKRIHFSETLREIGLREPLRLLEEVKITEHDRSVTLLELLRLQNRQDFYKLNNKIIKILMAFGIKKERADFIFALMGEMVDNAFAHNFDRWPLQKFTGGFLMVQKYPNRLEVAISDLGVGIKTALTSSPKYADLKTDASAIRKAMERNVTSRPQGSGGNGLPFILDSLRDEFQGDLDIWSGSCHLRFTGTSDKIVKYGKKILGTVIAFSMKI